MSLNLKELAREQWAFVEKQRRHNKTILEYLALIASEVGEAVNECRGSHISDKLGSELADIILRTIDLAEEFGIDIQEEVQRKMEFNKTRDFTGKVK